MNRKPLMAGNWKMYKTAVETQAFVTALKPLVAEAAHCDIAIFPPFVSVATAVSVAAGSRIEVGAQNLHWGKEGAFTGEISGHMLQAVGCKYVIIGHSERRQFFGDTDANVLRKALAALEFGLTPVVCVGEQLKDREEGRTEAVLDEQFDGGPGALGPEQFAKVVIAYEPVWAIGTGKTATPQIAEDAHRFIRNRVAERFGAAQAGATRILYGGSVKPDNVKSLMAEEDIDGALVGGASLDPKSFAAIVNYSVS